MTEALSPCNHIFGCSNVDGDKEDCSETCAKLHSYQAYLQKQYNCYNSAQYGESTIYNLPLAPPGEEGHVEDPYSSLLALETIYHHKVEAEEALVDEAIDSSFSQPLYNTYFKGETNEFTH